MPDNSLVKFLMHDGTAHAANAIAQSGVARVTVRTQFSPPIDLRPFAPGRSEDAASRGVSSALMSIVKPEIVVEGAFGRQVIAPWGSPSQNYLPYMVGLGAAAFAVASAACGVSRLAKLGALVAAGFVGAGYVLNRRGQS